MLLTGWQIPIVGEPDLGVDLFIMLSGFLMVFHYQLRQEKEPWQRPETWLKFWTRRYFRIAPVFYVMLFLALALGPISTIAGSSSTISSPDRTRRRNATSTAA
ncbi:MULTISPECIES: acyltransferase family protein [unclassified Mesorhizobium]|uniref:acyltransferase family protein n=1 Tax=unclassified Mesorhizobium TaxID=325217 RepID=UPI003338A2C6